MKHAFSLVAMVALLPAGVLAAEGTAPVFAAPGAAPSVAASSAGGIGQVTLALLLVLAAIFGVAWFMRRLRGIAGGAQSIEIVAQVALGARERAVVVKLGDTQLLLGVAPGRVNLLHVLPQGTIPAPAVDVPTDAARPDFATLLKKSLGR